MKCRCHIVPMVPVEARTEQLNAFARSYPSEAKAVEVALARVVCLSCARAIVVATPPRRRVVSSRLVVS